MNVRKTWISVLGLSAVCLAAFSAEDAAAHCDSVDGPVVKAAEAALRTSNVNLVLPWVKQDDEQSIRAAFAQTSEVRKLSPAARELADRYFFETLVRVHRAGEGAPYTGLKPAGQDLGPAIPEADKAIEAGSAEGVLKLLTGAIHHGVEEHFQAVKHAAHYEKNDVPAGREYVAKYVVWVHYIEGLYKAAVQSGHHQEADQDAHVHEEH